MRVISLVGMVVLLVVGLVSSAGPESIAEDERLLREHNVPTEGPALLEHLRKGFTSSITDEKLKQLIEQLGDDSFHKREEASRLLVQVGARGRKHLEAALKHGDLEVRSRAHFCLREIQKDGLSTQLLAACIRVLGERKPPGSAALLLEQLPNLIDNPILQPAGLAATEVLVSLAVRDGKADPVIVAALTDKVAAKRMAAGLALARARVADQMPALLKLLEDPERDVRVPLAMTLVRFKHKEAVPVLIAALDTPTQPNFGAIEEVLFHLARDKSPTLANASEAACQQYRKDWEAWWKENAVAVDLGVLETREKLQGRTVVVLLDAKQIVDLDGANNVRWKIDNVEMALDVQPLPGERVLVAEHQANRVTERSSKGEIVWEKRIAEPLTAQRLANGHTMIATKQRLVVVDRGGKEVSQYSPPAGAEIMRARRLPGGDTLLVTQLGGTHFLRIDRFGKAVKSFGVEVHTSGGRLDVSAAGNVLIPEMHNNRVCEYGPDGKVVRDIRVQQPIACVALPNGNVIVTSMTENRAVELTAAGKQVWEYRRETRVTRAVRY